MDDFERGLLWGMVCGAGAVAVLLAYAVSVAHHLADQVAARDLLLRAVRARTRAVDDTKDCCTW